MTLVAKQGVKDYFRITTTAEDTLIDTLIERAKAKIELLSGKPITEETIAWKDDAKSLRTHENPTALILKYVPVKTSDLVVTDRDGTALVVGTDYTVRQDLGLIVAEPGISFGNGPYTISGKAGLQHSAAYATRWEPFVNQVITDLVGFWLQQRTPGASSESAGGTSVGFVYGIDYGGMDAVTGLPKRILSDIRVIRGAL